MPDYHCSQGRQHYLSIISLDFFALLCHLLQNAETKSAHYFINLLFNSCNFTFSARLTEQHKPQVRHLCSHVINCSTWCHYHSQPSFLKWFTHVCIKQEGSTIIKLSVYLKHSALSKNNKQLWVLNYEKSRLFLHCINCQIFKSDKLGPALLSTSTWCRLDSVRQFHSKPLWLLVWQAGRSILQPCGDHWRRKTGKKKPRTCFRQLSQGT